MWHSTNDHKDTSSKRKVYLGFYLDCPDHPMSDWSTTFCSTSSLQNLTGALKLAKRAQNFSESARIGGDHVRRLEGACQGHAASAMSYDTMYHRASGWTLLVATDQGISTVLLPIDNALRHVFDLGVKSDKQSDHIPWGQITPRRTSSRRRLGSQRSYTEDFLEPSLLIASTHSHRMPLMKSCTILLLVFM